MTAQDRSDSSGSSREPSSSADIPNWAGSGAAWAKYLSVNSPRHDVIAMKAAIPAPDPLASYVSRTAARARSAAAASGSTGMSGGSWATRVVTSSGWAATSASAVTAPPLPANISTGPAPSASTTACTSSAWTVGAWSTPSFLSQHPRQSKVRESAAVGEPCYGGYLVALKREDEQCVRPSDVGLRTRQIAREGGLAVRARWH